MNVQSAPVLNTQYKPTFQRSSPPPSSDSVWWMGRHCWYMCQVSQCDASSYWRTRQQEGRGSFFSHPSSWILPNAPIECGSISIDMCAHTHNVCNIWSLPLKSDVGDRMSLKYCCLSQHWQDIGFEVFVIVTLKIVVLSTRFWDCVVFSVDTNVLEEHTSTILNIEVCRFRNRLSYAVI
jgi:hypothetical protein